MHVVIRRYSGAQVLATTMEQKAAEVEQLLRGVTGFRSYYAVRTDDGVATITVCDEKAGTDESIRVAADWVRQNIPAGAVNPPEVSEGETYLQFSR